MTSGRVSEFLSARFSGLPAVAALVALSLVAASPAAGDSAYLDGYGEVRGEFLDSEGKVKPEFADAIAAEFAAMSANSAAAKAAAAAPPPAPAASVASAPANPATPSAAVPSTAVPSAVAPSAAAAVRLPVPAAARGPAAEAADDGSKKKP